MSEFGISRAWRMGLSDEAVRCVYERVRRRRPHSIERISERGVITWRGEPAGGTRRPESVNVRGEASEVDWRKRQ